MRGYFPTSSGVCFLFPLRQGRRIFRVEASLNPAQDTLVRNEPDYLKAGAFTRTESISLVQNQ
jgi:hypothetical protein